MPTGWWLLTGGMSGTGTKDPPPALPHMQCHPWLSLTKYTTYQSKLVCTLYCASFSHGPRLASILSVNPDSVNVLVCCYLVCSSRRIVPGRGVVESDNVGSIHMIYLGRQERTCSVGNTIPYKTLQPSLPLMQRKPPRQDHRQTDQ